MSSPKNTLILLLAFLVSTSLGQQISLTSETQQSHLFISPTEQIMTTQFLASPLITTTTSLASICGNHQVENSLHLCIKPEYIEGCQVYESTLTCSKCSAGYSLTKEKKCSFQTTYIGTLRHIKGCIKQSADVCQVCAQGFHLKQNKCLLGVRNCALYNEQGDCIQCENDYSLILSQCRKNSLLGCKYETDLHTCNECYPPFTLNGQHCDIDECRILNDYGCVACECGYFLTPERDCKPIAPGCMRYEKGTCKDCLPHYKLKGGVCQIEGCLEYSGHYCKSCSEKYQLVEGQCKFKNCVDWLNDQCITCQQGFGLKNGVCIRANTVSCG